MNRPPPLPYAPTRTKPLSLWNTLDYLVLLYWVFYFPQALRWYVETFGVLPYDAPARQALREDAIQRQLAVQGLLIVVIVPFIVAAPLSLAGVQIVWGSLLFGILGGLMLGFVVVIGINELVGFRGGVIRGVILGVTGGMTWGIVFSLSAAAVSVIATITTWGENWKLLISAMASAGYSGVLGVVWSLIVGLKGGVEKRIVLAINVCLLIGFLSILVPSRHNTEQSAVFGILAIGMFAVAALRLDVAFLSLLFSKLEYTVPHAVTVQRCSPLPIHDLRRRLAHQLTNNWSEGLHESEGLLRYSLQFTPVIGAIKDTLKQLPPPQLLAHISLWCSEALYDWRIVFYQSADLRPAILKEFLDGLFIVPRRFRPTFNLAARYDTPVQAACAGFWHLHKAELANAVTAFVALRSLPHGEELYANALALKKAYDSQASTSIATWQPPSASLDPLLRPGVQHAFDELAQVVAEVAVFPNRAYPEHR